MSVFIHFIDVGFGNMTLIKFRDGTTYLYDCNVTFENESTVLWYLSQAMTPHTSIDAFVCSHRDADHMRGIKNVHARFPISQIWDAGVHGTTTNTVEYAAYMDLRQRLPNKVIKPRTFETVATATIRWMNGADVDYHDANDQSIVMKVEYNGASVLLAGDTSYRPWQERILRHYNDAKLQADILLGPHHGSLTFFDDPADANHYYTAHIRKINPAMTILSVGDNSHGLPDGKAIELYESHSRGSNKGNKLFTTQEKGNMRLELKDGGGWSLSTNQ